MIAIFETTEIADLIDLLNQSIERHVLRQTPPRQSEFYRRTVRNSRSRLKRRNTNALPKPGASAIGPIARSFNYRQPFQNSPASGYVQQRALYIGFGELDQEERRMGVSRYRRNCHQNTPATRIGIIVRRLRASRWCLKPGQPGALNRRSGNWSRADSWAKSA